MDIDCKERVAYDLMRFIQSSHTYDNPAKGDKEKVLDLYSECLSAVSGKRNWKPEMCGTVHRG